MGSGPDQVTQRSTPILAWILAIFGATVCLLVAVGFGAQQADNLWPLPGVYLVEVIVLGLAVVASLVLTKGINLAIRAATPWLAGGILLAFVILGGFSIGPYLFPALLAFWLVGVIVDLPRPRKIALHLGLALLLALLQGGIMLVVIEIGY